MTETKMTETKKEPFVKKLKEEEKVTIKILKKDKDKEGAFETVTINGYIYQIKKGESVQVPKTVARILSEAGKI